jgi:hypothetical protein
VLALAALIPASMVRAQATVDAQAANARRDDLKMIEGVLTNAVKNGADSLGRQMQITEPGSLIVTGTARARGFMLDGYGAFFIVDVPMMKQSVVWSAQMLLMQERRNFLRQFIATTADGPARRQAEQMLRNLDRGVVPAPSQAAPSTVADSTTSTVATTQPAPGLATAQNVPDPPGFPAVDPRDPNELYTEAVKAALIDAMVRYGSQLRMGPDEWMTVAAQDAEGPLPGQIYDASTIVLRIKGSDLAAYQASKLTKEEVMKKVEVREF